MKIANVIYQIPLAEIVFDFDKLKSLTRGYASFDYELSEYRPSKLLKWISFSMAIPSMPSAFHHSQGRPERKLIAEKLKGRLSSSTV